MSDFIFEHFYLGAYLAILLPMAAAFIGYFIGKKSESARDAFVYLAAGLELAPLIFMLLLGMKEIYGAPVQIAGICGMGLSFDVSGFRVLYGTVAAFMWFISILFSKQYFTHYRNRNRYYFFLLITLGATQGVLFANDFFTLFLFFEIMSFTSFVWVAHDERSESLRAADTYLGISVIGGLVMLMGIFLLYNVAGIEMSPAQGSLSFGDLRAFYARYAYLAAGNRVKLWAAGGCMLFGFGAKAGMFPLHIWLPKAHPVAPAPASALLSGILTKAGVLGILLLTAYVFLGNTFWGILILNLGVATMVIGAVLALFSVDLKRTLAASSVSQIGFILVGVGIAGILGTENVLAVRGSVLHMVNHSLFKLTLFQAAGVVFMNTHRLNLNDIRGFGRKKPLLHYIFLMGALGIGGIPLWNGYVSKTLIHEGIVEYYEIIRSMNPADIQGNMTPVFLKATEWAFLISGGLTVAYMAKLYVALFIEKNQDAAIQKKYDDLQGKYMDKVSAAALSVSATLLPFFGLFPNAVMGRVADMGQSFWKISEVPDMHWFSIENLKGALVSLLVGVLVYFLIVRTWMMKREAQKTVYVDRWNPYLDLENLIYRPLLLKVLPFVCGVVCRVLDSLADGVVVILRKTVYKDSKLVSELEEGTRMTHLLGSFLNAMQEMANKTFWKGRPRNTDHEHRLALLHEELTEDRIIIARSLSFGLLLFCVGLIITVAYLLVMA